MGKSRQSANLVSDNNIFVDIVNDRVGIGTDNPQYDLEVIGDINITGAINQNGNPFAAAGWSSGLGDDIYRLNGDVGIGTTNPAYKLDVHGDINFTGTFRQNGSIFVASRWTSGSGDDIYRLSGDVGIGTTNPSNTLTVYGDVGIGTTNTNNALNVLGNTFISGISTFTAGNNNPVVIRSGDLNSYTGINIGRVSTEAYFAIASGNSIYANDATAGDIVIRNENTNGKILFTRQGNNSSLAVAGSNVLVGSVSSTGTVSQPLQVSGGAYVSGNVGVGTTRPLQNLHVQGNLLVAAGSSTAQHITQKAYETNSGTLSWEGSAGQLFSITNNLTSGSIFSVNDVSGIPSIDVDANGTVKIAPYTGNILIGNISATGTASQRLQVTGGGYISGSVGIATTNPSATLDVNGSANITGSITAPDINDLYQLDDISFFIDGVNNTFIPKLNYERVRINDPFKLIISFNGLLQPAYVYNKEYVYTSYCLGARKGYTVDQDGNIKFPTPIEVGTEVIIRTTSGKTSTNVMQYPFTPIDIMF